MLIRLTSLKFVGIPVRQIWYTFGLSINLRGDLGLLTLKRVRVIDPCMALATLLPILVFLELFLLYSLSDGPRDLITVTFDFEGHGACQWCGSSCSSSCISLKLAGLPWLTSTLSISWPGDFEPLTLKLVRVIAHRVGNLPINFGMAETFHSRLMGQYLSDAPRDLVTWLWPWRSWHLSVTGVFVISCSIRLPSLKFVCRTSRSENIAHLLWEH